MPAVGMASARSLAFMAFPFSRKPHDAGHAVRHHRQEAFCGRRAWLPVSMQDSAAPVVVFQYRMHRSAVPPPLASSPCWWGDHAIALTAACTARQRGQSVQIRSARSTFRLRASQGQG